MLVPTIKTERLELRAYEVGDIAELVSLIGAREVAANLARVPYPYTEQDARNFIGSIKQTPEEARFAVVLGSDRRLIGGIGLRIDSAHSRAELGYWLGASYWGQGYATEAAHAVMQYGFHTLGLNRIWASVFEGNAVSARVLKKVGMSHEGCFRQHVLKWGRFIDLAIYGTLRSEWK